MLRLLVVVCLTASAVQAGESDLAKAQKLLLTGKYAEAEELFRPSADRSPEAALGLARCHEAQGRTDEAVKVLGPLAEKHAELLAELARLALERGDVTEAKARSDAALHLAPEQLLAQFIRAELARASGRLDDADRGYNRLIGYYNGHDIRKADALRWIGLAAAQHARWNRLSDQFDFLVNELYPEALKLDPGYWPAHYEAGLLFMEKYNRADAVKELDAAKALNPNAAEVHAARAALALEEHDLDAAQASLRRALEINPRLLAAWHLTADLTWVNLRAEECLKVLQEKALPLNPVCEETLGRIAACYLLLDGVQPGPAAPDSRFAKLVDEVTRRNARAGEFFATLAQLLEVRNKQAEAEAYFREAIRVMPRQVGPHAGLGLLYMRTGQETEARKLLAEAFDADPFHVRVKNTLEVLDVLGEMQTRTTPHFTIRYDKADELLARYAARHLERIYPQMVKDYGYEPPGSTLVEIFREARGRDGHAWFSARMVGLPYLGTVAACTGRIVAMTSPSEPGLGHAFNWSRVLTHELTHIFNLQQTRFNIPHWFTEGLAVRSENTPRQHRWNELLRKRVLRGKLFTLETVDGGFVRPGSGDDCQMAYCQGLLYVEYMTSRGGPEAVRKMLAAYTETASTASAIRRALGVSQEEFERGYADYVKKLVDGQAVLEEPPEASIEELERAQCARPGDAEAAARLAYGYLRRGAEKESLAMAQKALATQPKHQLATYVLTRIHAGEKGPKETMAALEACLDRKAPCPLVLQMLASMKLKAERYEEAADLYALAERLDPGNPKWTSLLARVYLLAEKKPALAAALARVARLDADDAPSRRKLAELALGRRDFAAAADWAAQVLEIRLGDAEAHRLLATALAELRQYDRAIEEFETAIELNPGHSQQRLALADACIQARQPAKARQTLQTLLKMTPDFPGAEALLESLKKTP